MIELLNWASENPKLALGILGLICGTVIVCVYAICEHKYGERF